MIKRINITLLLVGLCIVGYYISYDQNGFFDNRSNLSFNVMPLGVLFIVFAYFWYKYDAKNEAESGISKNFKKYINSIGKVGLLMFGLLCLLFPVFNFIVLPDSQIADSIQMFNGVAAIILGLAIAGAGAWVSIKLAYVATEIASNHYYSEESKKRYDEASEAAELMRQVDLCLSRIFNKINIFKSVSEKVSKNKSHPIASEHASSFVKNLKYIAEEGVILGELYQKALNTPTLLEIIESEAIFASSNSDEKRGNLPEDIQKHLMHLTLNMKVLNIIDKDENKPESEQQIARRIYQTMQYYSDVLITESLKNIDKADSMTEHEIIEYCNSVVDIVETIKNIVKKSRERRGIKKPSSVDNLYEDSLVAFTLLDYMFTREKKYDGKPPTFENNSETIRKKSSEDISKQVSEKSFLITNAGTTNERIHERDDSSTLQKKRKKQDAVDKKTTELKSSSNRTLPQVNNIKPDNETQESLVLISKNKIFIDSNEEGNYENSVEKRILLSPSKFPAVMYLLPRVPRGGLSALDKREHQSDADFIKTIYKGVHILRHGLASMDSDASVKHSKNLQIYIYRTLAVSNHLSDRLIEPLTLHEIDPFESLKISRS